jgi:hypothetical protein
MFLMVEDTGRCDGLGRTGITKNESQYFTETFTAIGVGTAIRATTGTVIGIAFGVATSMKELAQRN